MSLILTSLELEYVPFKLDVSAVGVSELQSWKLTVFEQDYYRVCYQCFHHLVSLRRFHCS